MGTTWESRKIHWIKWDELPKSKMVGRVGFRDLKMFSDSLLANKRGDFCTTKTLFYINFSKPFFPIIALLWRPKIHGRALMLGITFSREGRLLKRGHNGRLGMVNLLKYSRIIGSQKDPPLVSSPVIASIEETIVATLIDPLTRQWNHGINDGVFAPEEADLIKNIPLARIESRGFFVLALNARWMLLLQIRLSLKDFEV